MKKYLLHPVFVIACIGVLIHQVSQKWFHLSFPFIDSYLDDFLGVIIVLTILLAEQTHIWKQLQRPFKGIEIVGFVCLFGLFFEELLPAFNNSYTRDLWDYLAYSIGGLVFYYSINQIKARE